MLFWLLSEPQKEIYAGADYIGGASEWGFVVYLRGREGHRPDRGLQYHTLPLPCNATQYHTMPWKRSHRPNREYNTILCNTMHYYALPCNSKEGHRPDRECRGGGALKGNAQR